MHDDEPAIRAFFSAWHAATVADDLPKLLSLMADDAVFLVARRAPFDKDQFAADAQAGRGRQRIDYAWQAEEIVVAGDVAYCRCHLDVTVSPLPAGEPQRLRGYTLTVLRKHNGGWVLARDANLLAPA